MNPYVILGSGAGTPEATDLSARLSAWHDAMVAHERRLRAGTTGDACDDECPHAEARTLWSEAVEAFGARAQELTFLRSRAQASRRPVSSARGTHGRSEAAEYANGPQADSRADSTTAANVASTAVAVEL